MLLVAVSLAVPVYALTLEGVDVPAQVRLGKTGPALYLNGAGVRQQTVFKVYVSALYLPRKDTNGEAILARDEPRRLSLRFLRDVTAAQFKKSTDDALAESLTAAQRKPLEPQLGTLRGFLEEMPDVRKGSLITIDYLPGRGTVISLDGKPQQRIAGAEFNRALMRIWIGDKPRDPQLRDAMLGRL